MDTSQSHPGLCLETLSADTLRWIFQHAEACYPDECCGFVRASGALHRAENDQGRLHALNPERWPRCARKAYAFAPRDLLALNRSLEEADPAVVLYHSHPDAFAYFSRKDEQDALVAGEPILPVDFLVVEVREGRAITANLYHFARPGFHCVWTSDSFQQEGVHANV